MSVLQTSDPGAKLKWYKISTDSSKKEFITDQRSFVRAPITNEDLGRYRCITENSHGSRYQEAVLSKQNDHIEFLIYGFVDKQSDLYQPVGRKAISLKFKSEVVDLNKVQSGAKSKKLLKRKLQ